MERDVKEWISNRLKLAPTIVDKLLLEDTGGIKFKRHIYTYLKDHLNSFLESKSGSKWIIMSGLRGVGKTTLLGQLYSDPQIKDEARFYLSLDVVKKVGATIIDVEEAIEDILGHKIESYPKPLYIFLDEVHFLSDWSLAIKTLVDSSSKLFVVCTGSSALTLQTNADVARRASFTKIHPLSFTEFVSMKQVFEKKKDYKSADSHLSQEIKKALFESNDVMEVDKRLKAVEPAIESYWSDLNIEKLITEYLAFGSLPFVLKWRKGKNGFPNQLIGWQQVVQTIDNVLLKDIMSLEKFDSYTLNLFPKLLFLLAQADSKTLRGLADDLKISSQTVQNMLNVLFQSEIIIEIKPRGYGHGHVRKAHKYRFNSAAMRMALSHEFGYNIMTSKSKYNQFQGYLLEDVIASYLKRFFVDRPLGSSLEYDAKKGGADFIISRSGLKKEAVVIEVGMQKTKTDQVLETLKKGGRYGLVLSGVADFGRHITIGEAQPLRTKVDIDKKVISVAAPIFLLL